MFNDEDMFKKYFMNDFVELAKDRIHNVRIVLSDTLHNLLK